MTAAHNTVECTCTGGYMRQQGPAPGPSPSPQHQMGVSPQHQMAGSPQRQPPGRQHPRDRPGALMRPQQNTGYTPCLLTSTPPKPEWLASLLSHADFSSGSAHHSHD